MSIVPLAARTTLRVGGVPRAELVISSLGDCDALLPDLLAGESSWRVLGAGSNIVAADGDLDLTVVLMRSHHIEALADADSIVVTVDAGAQWDELVDMAVSRGWSGIEALSGIPGSVGATPIQNVGAYGAQVSDVITEVEFFDADLMCRRWIPATECGFGYRTSSFKRVPGRRIITRVRMRLGKSPMSRPIAYTQLATALSVSLGAQVPLLEARTAVLALRRSKGMVLDPADHDSWSVGSYFTNPVVSRETAASRAADGPQWEQPNGDVKLSAAWLIESAGFPRGYQLDGSGIALSSKHSLAITNRGNGTAAEVRQLEGAIIGGVHERFGVTLEREPLLLGFAE